MRYKSKVRTVGLFIAMGISENAHREILGFSIFNKKSEYNWNSFFQGSKKRGLENIDIITSDNHFGLVKAIRSEFIETSWQRCQTHFSKNMINATPKHLQAQMSLWLKFLYNIKRLNEEIRRRESVIRIFPNEYSVIRLLGSLLMEYNEKWITEKIF